MTARLLDLRPLRGHPEFRRLWAGTAAIALGGQVAAVAVLADVWALTGDVVVTGLVGLVTGAAILTGGMLGGTLADTTDRRRLVLLTGAGSATAAAGLAAQGIANVGSVALVVALVALQTVTGALGSAARRAYVARLLPRELVGPGVALSHVSFQIAMLVGPAAAGLLIARGGTAVAYVVDAVAITASLYGIARLPRVCASDAARPDGQRGGHLRATVEGWRFVARRPVLRGALATDLAQTTLAMPVALFPALNAERFGGDPRTLGLFLSAVALGGLVASTVSGPVARAERPGLVGLVAAGVWGLALAAFGLVDGLIATMVALAVAGAADTVSVISRGTLVQLATPEAYRGRVSAAEYVVGAGGPGFGDARAGLVAGLTSASTSAVGGGIACAVVVAGLAAAQPALRRWRVRDG